MSQIYLVPALDLATSGDTEPSLVFSIDTNSMYIALLFEDF